MLRSRPLALPALLASALAVCLCIRAKHGRPQQDHPDGRYTAGQVLDQSELMCHMIAPQLSTLRLVAEPTRVQARHYWTVLCIDANGQEISNLTWEADTGQLVRVRTMPDSESGRARMLLSRSAAVAQGWSWMQALGFAARSRHWRMVGPPLFEHRQLRTWEVSWAGGKQEVTVVIEAHSGELLAGGIRHVRQLVWQGAQALKTRG